MAEFNDDWIAHAHDHELVKALCDVEEGLSEWEIGFSEDIYKWCVQEGKALSTRPGGQRETAQKILRRVS